MRIFKTATSEVQKAAWTRHWAQVAQVLLLLVLISLQLQSCVCSKKSEMLNLRMPAFSSEVQSHSTCNDE